MTVLDIMNVSCRKQTKILFRNIRYKVRAGELLWVTGKNGSGKSSFLRLLIGFDEAEEGEIFFQERAIKSFLAYRQKLHYISHSYGLKLGLTVAENIKLMSSLYLNQSTPQENFLLEELGLDLHLHKFVYQLSAGQKRRLALAKLFLFHRPLWILDEPLTALDPAMQLFFFNQLKNHLSHEGIAVVTSHQPIQLNPQDHFIHHLHLSLC